MVEAKAIEPKPFNSVHERWSALSRSALLTPRLRRKIWIACGLRIEEDLAVMEGVIITGPRISIGVEVFLNRGCFLDGAGDIVIGSGVSLACGVRVLSTTHEIGQWERRAGVSVAKQTSIGKGVWVGANAVILPGVQIGAGTIIGAGSVVTSDIASNSLAYGNPARVMRALDK